jgi:hypothetical protein
MTLEKIRTISANGVRLGQPKYPFDTDGVAFRCKDCEGIWLKENDAKLHKCEPKC